MAIRHDGISRYGPPPKQVAGSCRCKLTYERLSGQLLIVDVLFRRFDAVAVGLEEFLAVCAHRQALHKTCLNLASRSRADDIFYLLPGEIRSLPRHSDRPWLQILQWGFSGNLCLEM